MYCVQRYSLTNAITDLALDSYTLMEIIIVVNIIYLLIKHFKQMQL